MKPPKGIHPQTGAEADILQPGTIELELLQSGTIRLEIEVKDFMDAPYSGNQAKDHMDAPYPEKRVKDRMDAHH